MTTVMWWGDSDGTRGRCDAKCHNATGPACRCLCGGRFHGMGRMEGGHKPSVDAYFQEITTEAAQQGMVLHLPDGKPRIVIESAQISLFQEAE